MMNGSNDRETIKEFIEQEISTIEEKGAVTAVGMVHHAHSGPVELHVISGGPKWGNAEAMSYAFDAVATRHAKGVSSGGAQQYEIYVTRGNKEQTSVLPFVRVGAANLIGPNGSLATEPPSITGQVSQGMRLLELAFQEASAQGKQNIVTLQFIIQQLTVRLKDAEENNRDLWVNLKNVLLEMQKLSYDQKLKLLNTARMGEMQKQLIKLAPALLNMMAGNEVFPYEAADTEFVELIASVADPKDIEMIQSALSSRPNGQLIAASLASRINAARQRMVENHAAEKKMIDGLEERTFEEAERDVAGMAIKALKGQPPLEPLPELRYANGTRVKPDPQPVKTAPTSTSNESVTAEVVNEDTAMWDDFFRAMGDRASVLFNMTANEDPELAKRMQARYEAMKKV